MLKKLIRFLGATLLCFFALGFSLEKIAFAESCDLELAELVRNIDPKAPETHAEALNFIVTKTELVVSASTYRLAQDPKEFKKLRKAYLKLQNDDQRRALAEKVWGRLKAQFNLTREAFACYTPEEINSYNSDMKKNRNTNIKQAVVNSELILIIDAIPELKADTISAIQAAIPTLNKSEKDFISAENRNYVLSKASEEIQNEAQRAAASHTRALEAEVKRKGIQNLQASSFKFKGDDINSLTLLMSVPAETTVVAENASLFDILTLNTTVLFDKFFFDQLFTEVSSNPEEYLSNLPNYTPKARNDLAERVWDRIENNTSQWFRSNNLISLRDAKTVDAVEKNPTLKKETLKFISSSLEDSLSFLAKHKKYFTKTVSIDNDGKVVLSGFGGLVAGGGITAETINLIANHSHLISQVHSLPIFLTSAAISGVGSAVGSGFIAKYLYDRRQKAFETDLASMPQKIKNHLNPQDEE